MTPFQAECERRIKELADQIGQQVRDQYSEGEKYLTGKLDEYQFWVYDTDDADFKSDWYAKVFERLDFESQEQQLRAFIDGLKFAIENKDQLKRNPQPSTPPILNRLLNRITSLWKK